MKGGEEILPYLELTNKPGRTLDSCSGGEDGAGRDDEEAA